MKCPTCNGDCIIPAEQVLDTLLGMYMACNVCPPDPGFNKSLSVSENIDRHSGLCMGCGKRHLDFVMAHILTIIKKLGLVPDDASLREVGTPLISFGYNVPYAPRLGSKNLVMIMDSVTKEAASEIVDKVPEVKGIILRKGLQSQSVGILDTTSPPHFYELLSGCDMRGDIVSSLFGELCIYKSQSRIHIEFNNTKIQKIEELYINGELERTSVIDGFCGPGTLGLLCILAGAGKVILNDAWLPAVLNTILNLKINAGILGIEMDFEKSDNDKVIGDEPVLMARAHGKAEVLVYHGDFRNLHMDVGESDICLVDTFPLVQPSSFMPACRDISKKMVII